MNRSVVGAPGALLALSLMLVAGGAAAQGNPKFEYGKAEEVKTVEWKSQVKGGLLATTGNSQTLNGSVGATLSRKEGNNKFALEAAAAYGRSRVTVATVDPNDPTVWNARRDTVVTTNNWLTRGRYDRFFTLNNAGYVMGLGGADRTAGKSFTGGGQIGYSRQVFKNDMHLIVAELGYDFSHESYVQPTLAAVSIHSARLFLGDTFKLSEVTGLTAGVEALFNLNKEGSAINVATGTPGVDAFKDTRVNAKLGLSTTLYKSLSIGLGFLLKYDQNPAPRPRPAGVPAAAMVVFDPSLGPFADEVDMQGEVTLLYTFL